MISETMAFQFAEELASQPLQIKMEGLKKLCDWALEALLATPPQATLALVIAIQAKRLGVPFQDVDYLRAVSFLHLGRNMEAFEALKEELRWFPDNQAAKSLIADFQKNERPKAEFSQTLSGFERIYSVVQNYTMVGKARIRAMHLHAKRILRSGICGNFVECGVAGGGSSGLLAKVINDLAPPDVRLFCCDSFSGMPTPTEYDVHEGQHAEETGWGTGTCSAPEFSVQEICSYLGAAGYC